MTTTKDRRPAARPTVPESQAAAGKAAARSGNGRSDDAAAPGAGEAAAWAPMTATFAGLAEAPAQWLSQVTGMMAPKAGAHSGQAAGSTGAGWMREAVDYWVDAAQRQVLFWDVMRKRGNQALEHYRQGKPPVLVFDYELILDGRELERPVNYMLLGIKPAPGVAIDPVKRPFVIVDPRAGHGPGIGGMKESSQVGIALRNGHPVYFVAFHPEPEPGQTIADVGFAETQFLLEVHKRHPESEKPVVVGNCQAGWAIMMLAAAAPDLVGLVSIAGAPLSYWAGVEGKNPMRYTGGLLGGSWLASLAGDLGNGTFDGVNLVSNFENLNPANSLWAKQYNLYAKIDTEEQRYLGFEKWWTGYFFMTREEMRSIADELFVGNKLTKGTILTKDRRPIDLRNIKAPIVVIASFGDNITPPQQALNWIPDLYDNVAEIVANEQTIIYTLDERVGHLGIFVSAKVAEKQHAELVNTLDLIEVLPPGLYEMVIEDKTPADVGADLLPGQYLVRFEGRTTQDILALADGRQHEQAFETAARISEINEGLYDMLIGPWVRMWSNEASAEALRLMHPLRLQRFLLSDLNPAMWAVKRMADLVRDDRRPAAAGNALVTAEHAVSEQIEQGLDRYRELRDRLYELTFKTVYNAPLLEALAGLRAPHADARKPRAHNQVLEELLERQIAAIRAREHQGGFAEAVLRIMLAGAKAHRMIDARGFRLAQQLGREHPRLKELGHDRLKAIAKEAAFMVRFDEEHALASLPKLLPSEADRREALDVVRKVGRARREIGAEGEALLARVERILRLEPAAPARRSKRQPATAGATAGDQR